MRFLTREVFAAAPTPEVMALIPAEQARVKELKEQGTIEALYVAADQSGAWMIWNVDSKEALDQHHHTLPLHPYMKSEITVLSEGM